MQIEHEEDWIKEVKVKKGVSLSRLKPEIRLALKTAYYTFLRKRKSLLITSTNDGKHMHGSKHYVDQAFDVRSWFLTSSLKKEIISECKTLLGKDYDIIIEPTHLHFEYDPK